MPIKAGTFTRGAVPLHNRHPVFTTVRQSMKHHATAAFHRPPERYNCAQAVLDAFQSVTGRSVAPVADYKAHGGGRAPGGECGALYAACQCAPEAATALRSAFVAKAGSTLCREIKGERRYPCSECVGTAAELLSVRNAQEKQP